MKMEILSGFRWKSITSKSLLFFAVAMIPCFVYATKAYPARDNAAFSNNQHEKKITGYVKNSEGESLIGVNISVKGSTNGTTTNVDGYFSLPDVSDNAVLNISYVGYAPQSIVVREQSNFLIKMIRDEKLIDEVVVVGATFKKSDLTGSVAHVDAAALEKRPVTTINEAIQGHVAGVFINNSTKPSDDASVKIRGINTINSGSSPIYVVDGIVMDNSFGSFNSINLNDVASVEVLKDASATALYGSRGANGVIVITTKKGSKGEGTINYDGWVSFSNFANTPKVMNAEQLFDLRADAYINGYLQSNPNGDANAYKQNYILGTNNVFSAAEMATYKANKSYNWLEDITHTGIEQNHALSFSAGNDKSSLFLSYGYTNIKGLVSGTDQDKYTGRINADYNIKSWLKVGTNTSFNRVNDDITNDNVFDKALSANPLLDYSPYKDDATRYTSDYLTLYYRVHSEENNNDYNPYNTLDMTTNRVRNHLSSSNFININPIQNLNIRSTFAIDFADQAWFEYTPSNIQESIRHNSGDAKATHQRWNQFNYQWDNSVSYNLNIDKHHLNLLAGTSTSKNSNDFTGVTGYRYASDDLTYKELYGTAALEKSVLDSEFKTYTLQSFLTRFNYNFNDRYFLTGTVREDGSSRFGKGHKWGTFPSVSGAWNVTSEEFMQSQNIIDLLKLRIGYGSVGNQDITDFAYVTLYMPSVSSDKASYVNSGLRGTPNLTWEKQKQTNVGMDLALFKGKLKITADAFKIINDNLLMNRTLPTTSGYTNAWENIGAVENKGFEFSANAEILKAKDFSWDISGNISFDHNKVTKLYSDTRSIYNTYENVVQRTGNIFLNESLNTIYTYKCGGIANESNRSEWENIDFNGHNVSLGDLFVKDVSGKDGKPDGKIDENDKIVVGKSDPEFYGGFSTDLNYKKFTLSALFTYSYGAKKISSYYEGLISSVGLSNATCDLLDRWSSTNTDAKNPRVITNASGYNRFSAYDCDFAIQNASYLRLSALTLAYSLPSSWGIKNLRAYVTASNLFCLTPYKGFDPETGDYGYPASRKFVAGVNFSF